jgi:uncharacterized protein with PIN domain
MEYGSKCADSTALTKMINAELKFIVDHNVGKMAKWLRMAGFDTLLFTGADDDAIVAAALDEKRILLTRDRRIMKRRVIVAGNIKSVLIESDQFTAQVWQVISALKLDKDCLRPFTICLECNRQLEERTKKTVKDRVPPYVFLTQEHFAECPTCHRLYWQGSHWQSMSWGMDAFWRCP